ncbi:hypothetical protein DHEL01_v202090 [Diaporthe helianthi]|uniref:WSC domain-containing protein n=1 Tax=Diaporthe helianthi TaxID=158607 RepID=A0A2P5IAF8_DIAHE|nr:hypothetical protein DHEL01_v202090 [Diaporthe helianthi]
MHLIKNAVVLSLSLAASVRSDPTWPAATDEIEEIMYQLYGSGARLFADTITPCSKEAHGVGRKTASEWLRVAFHDMATANTFFGIGGIDASLMYELKNGENLGPGLNTSLITYADFFSPRSTMSDLIALGASLATRVCGGPVVPVRGGRIDATSAGSPGVPQPQNAISTFINQFSRMGFTQAEMIGLVACGHTIGGVHSTEFPVLVPAGTATNNESALDSTPDVFDNKVVTEYLDGTTKNPLVVGPSVAAKQNADFVVYNSDKNVTMKTLASPTTFASTCASLLQRMIDVVPSGVALSDPILPYAVKPVGLQLTMNGGGASLQLGGSIRVRTTGLAQAVSGVTLAYKDRSGASCDSCTISATRQASGSGVDDTFGYFPLDADIAVESGISSFTITLEFADGTTKLYDNNGNAYPISDAVILQRPQSCLLQGPGSLSVSALVLSDRAAPVSLGIQYQTPQSGIAGPRLQTADVTMVAGACVGPYTFYSASYAIPGGRSYAARLDITSGSGTSAASNTFNLASELAGTCLDFSGAVACGSSPPSLSSSAVSSTLSTVAVPSRSLSTYPLSIGSVLSAATSSIVTASSSSTSAVATLAHKATVAGYELVSCWTEGTGVRALSASTYSDNSMTLETCAAFCAGYKYFGVEYGRECYCGNTLDASTESAPLDDCNMVCSGSSVEYCGSGNRLELYLNNSTDPGTGSGGGSGGDGAEPTQPDAVGAYKSYGCVTEADQTRALTARSFVDSGMTLERCASFCSAYTYFGVEYARECNATEFCGGSNRLSAYEKS